MQVRITDVPASFAHLGFFIVTIPIVLLLLHFLIFMLKAGPHFACYTCIALYLPLCASGGKKKTVCSQHHQFISYKIRPTLFTHREVTTSTTRWDSLKSFLILLGSFPFWAGSIFIPTHFLALISIFHRDIISS